MPSLNRCQIIGHLGRDPEMRFTPSGSPVTNFTVAVNNRFTNSQGETYEETEWVRVTCWGKLAEVCNQYLIKGRLVYADGRIKLNTWESPEGEARSNLELVANKVLFLERESRSQGSPDDSGEIESPEDTKAAGTQAAQSKAARRPTTQTKRKRIS